MFCLHAAHSCRGNVQRTSSRDAGFRAVTACCTIAWAQHRSPVLLGRRLRASSLRQARLICTTRGTPACPHREASVRLSTPRQGALGRRACCPHTSHGTAPASTRCLGRSLVHPHALARCSVRCTFCTLRTARVGCVQVTHVGRLRRRVGGIPLAIFRVILPLRTLDWGP